MSAVTFGKHGGASCGRAILYPARRACFVLAHAVDSATFQHALTRGHRLRRVIAVPRLGGAQPLVDSLAVLDPLIAQPVLHPLHAALRLDPNAFLPGCPAS